MSKIHSGVRLLMDRLSSQQRRTKAFTLIELLVVIAIIALLIGILIPALSKARTTARSLKCLTNCRGMGQLMTMYSNDNKSWYPVMPELTSDGFLNRQHVRGGVSGLFSLNQAGPVDDGQARAGWTGISPDLDETDILDSYLNITTNPNAELPTNGPRVPLMRNYMSTFEVLNCPSDKEDIYYGQAQDPGDAALTYTPSTFTGNRGPRLPLKPGSEREVSWTTVSYLYIAGLKTDEANIPFPPPLWGDETNGPDVGTKAWYGASANSTTLNDQMREAGVRFPGGYGKIDNHGPDGANFVYADGHGAFVTGSIQAEFFADRDAPNSQHSINAVKSNRSNMIQTID